MARASPMTFSSHRQSSTGRVVVTATCATTPLSQISKSHTKQNKGCRRYERQEQDETDFWGTLSTQLSLAFAFTCRGFSTSHSARSVAFSQRMRAKLVDTRTIGRAPHFDSERSGWLDGTFQLAPYVEAANQECSRPK